MSDLITLKDNAWLFRQKKAGLAVHNVISNFRTLMKQEKLNSLEVANLSERTINHHGCIPTFKGYKGFPSPICLSINEVIVHGIPYDYDFKDGDVVTIDVGATYDGSIADGAWTCIFGNPKPGHKEMVSACFNALKKAQEAFVVGGRLGDIGAVINASKGQYGVITQYGGHGLDTNKPHAPPFVSNEGVRGEGIRFSPGLTIAIEPMFLIGKDTSTYVGEDGWSVICQSVGAHFEHTISIDEDGVVHKITDYGAEWDW